MYSEAEIAWMKDAIALAKNGLYTTRVNPRVGCVLVKNGQKIASGWHEFPGGPHAEINALSKVNDARGATCYVTLAPCAHYGKTPPCTEALIQAGITRVVVACEDPNPLVGKNSQERLMQAGIAYASGLCQAEAHALNQGFFMRMQAQRPFVRLKTAMSLDGRTAMKCGQSQWITGIPSRQLVQKLRAQSDVILTGIETVLIDDPSLTVRDEEILSLTHFKPPHRVILDTALRMPLGAKLLSLPAEVWIYTCSADEEKKAALSERGAKIFMMPEKDRCVDLVAVMHHLAEQQVNEVLVEAGSRLNGSFLQAGLVDEWHLFIAPKIMGDTARGLCTLPITELTEAYALTIKQHFQVGEDWCVIAHPAQHSA